jgi:hypothetical protein
LLAAVGEGSASYCTSCYTGKYPVAFPRDADTYLQLALKPVVDETHGGPAEGEEMPSTDRTRLDEH